MHVKDDLKNIFITNGDGNINFNLRKIDRNIERTQKAICNIDSSVSEKLEITIPKYTILNNPYYRCKHIGLKKTEFDVAKT